MSWILPLTVGGSHQPIVTIVQLGKRHQCLRGNQKGATGGSTSVFPRFFGRIAPFFANIQVRRS